MLKLFDPVPTRPVSFLRAGLCIALLVLGALAEPERPNFNRPQTFDVQHYKIAVSFDRAKKRVLGETTITLKPLGPRFRKLDLDAVGMVFESVALIEPSRAKLSHSAAGGMVHIMLDRDYSPSETLVIALKYTATPKKGVYFIPAERGHSAQIWTQGEPDEARHWFPSFDFPSDRATTEQIITAEKGETVIGNGELVEKKDNADGTETWHYKMPLPHSTYLVSFVIGRYVKLADKFGEIPLAYYVYPGREETAKKAFSRTPEMMRLFEGLTRIKYPFNKYDQTIVAKFEFGGMENVTATTMADTEIFYVDMGIDMVDLVSHELAHSWFGNLVTCRNWAELWLNEGFATYMEAVWRETTNGREDYLRKVRSDAAAFLIHDTVTRKRHGLFNLRADKVEELFDDPSVTYNKGGAVLHMLREQIGTEAFWKGVTLYLNRHKLSNVESTDLRRAMEEASGQDLGWFFDQWVYGTGAPSLTVAQTFNERAKTLAVTVTQTQTAGGATPAVFRLPLDLTIATRAGNISHKIEITKRSQTFTFPIDARPNEIILDPDDKVVIKNVKLRPMATAR